MCVYRGKNVTVAEISATATHLVKFTDNLFIKSTVALMMQEGQQGRGKGGLGLALASLVVCIKQAVPEGIRACLYHNVPISSYRRTDNIIGTPCHTYGTNDQ